MNNKRERIIFFMCYIRNKVVNMACRRCPFYKLAQDRRGICLLEDYGDMNMDCAHYLYGELNKNNMRLDLDKKDWVMIF